MNPLRRVRSLFRRDQLDREMDAEMRVHLEEQTQRNVAAGMSPDEARAAARRQFGGVAQIQERARDQRGFIWLEQFWRDGFFAFRRLARSPGFALVAISTLALGIGLNTAMFSFVNALMLRPLPYPDSDQLVQIFRQAEKGRTVFFRPTTFLDLQREEAAFGRFAAYRSVDMNLDDSGRSIPWMQTTVNLFDVIGIQPNRGRSFRPDEGTAGRDKVVVISDAVWRTQFNHAADVVGQTIRANGEIYEVIGVLPATATGGAILGKAGVFSPVTLDDISRSKNNNRSLLIIGRRDASVSLEQADHFIEAFGRQQAAVFPAENAGSSWQCETLGPPRVGTLGASIVFMLLGLSVCVLAIACSNLANLLLARAVERSPELAVRAALGASRLELVRPLAIEAAILATLGTGGALFVSIWTTEWLDAVIQTGGGPFLGFPMDWRVLGFALSVSVLTMMFFGVGPALFVSRVKVNERLKNGARNATGAPGYQRFRTLLIAGQFAAAMVLLAGAGFFLRGANNLLQRDFGWASAQVVKGELTLPEERYADDTAIIAFQQRLTEHLKSLPGASAVCLSDQLPYTGIRGWQKFVTEEREDVAAGSEFRAAVNAISPTYFDVTGTRVIAGRLFTPRDTATSPKVTIISESGARSLFPGQNPVGRRIALAGIAQREWWEIVGVVQDAHSAQVAHPTLENQLYRPITQTPNRFISFAIKTKDIAPGIMIQSIRAAVTELDPQLITRDLATANQDIDQANSPVYFCRQLLSAFAVLGLLLAALGVYSVIARQIAQRSNEIGIRMALGANKGDIIRLVLGFGIRIIFAGVALGLFGAWGLSQLLASVLPNMQTNSPLVLASAMFLLIIIALAACCLPARRAAKVDPVIALRAD